jgi:serine/threonine-protein kinase
LLGKIGQGGMGAVFRARQKSLDRIVALKIMPPSIAKDAEYLERFQREARASARLSHPHIVQGIDVGQDPATGLWYFAMELVDGPSLKQVLQEQKVVPEERALQIAAQAAEALEGIAKHGMVHRDIKPDNILLTPDGEVKVADLGLAKRLADDSSITQSGNTVGTPHYMAPEQVRGRMDLVDIRSDIYALGATLFHLVTGRPPFDGETSAVIMSRHLTEPAPKANRVNPEVSEGCALLIERMMQKKPEQRIQTPAELLKQIEKVQRGDTTGLRPAVRTRAAAPVMRSKRETPARKGSLGALVTFVLVVLALGAVGLAYHMATKEQSGTATASLENEKKNEPPKDASPAAPKTDAKEPAAVAKNADVKTPGKTEAPATEATETTVGPAVAATKTTKRPGVPDDAEPPPADAKTEPGKEPAKKDGDGLDDEPPGVARGGFRGQYYTGQGFDTLKTTRADEVVDFRWPKGAPDGFSTQLGFSARWEGYIEPPATGEYVFEIAAAGGGRFFLDGWVLFDGWSGRLQSGRTPAVKLETGKKYLVRFDVRNRGDNPAGAKLRWGLAEGETVPVRAEPPETIDLGAPMGHLTGGWQAEYGALSSAEPLVARHEVAVNWNWGGASPALEIPAEKFWSRWTGLVTAPEDGEYVFHVEADNGARLYLNGMLLMDTYSFGPPDYKTTTPPVKLAKGKKYLVKLQHYQRGDYAACALRWSSGTLKNALVLASEPGDPDGVLTNDGFTAEYGVQGSEAAKVTRREPRIDWNWRTGSPADEIPGERFWSRYAGWIKAPADGEYFFTAEYDDGVQVWLDDVYLLNASARGEAGKTTIGPLSLKGEKYYPLRVHHWEGGDYARIGLYWRSAEMPNRAVTGVIPEAVDANDKDAAHLECGALTEYGTAKVPVITRLEGRLNRDFHRGGPGAGIDSGVFWGRWTTGLKITNAGQYAFKLDAEARAEFKLQGRLVLKVPIAPPKGPRPAKADDAPRLSAAETPALQLSKATYLLELSLTSQRLGGDYPTYIKLLWKPPGKAEFEDIPPDALLLPPQAREAVRRGK